MNLVVFTLDERIIEVGGLDGYFFLRFLRTILKIFLPASGVTFVLLLPMSLVHGGNGSSGVHGLDRLTWAGVDAAHSSYHWAHLVAALALVTYFCWVFHQELLHYIKIRQMHLVHRVSTRTVLISGIPKECRSVTSLTDMYNRIGRGVSEVWLNRDVDDLSRKIEKRDELTERMEATVADLIRKAVRRYDEVHRRSADNAQAEEHYPGIGSPEGRLKNPWRALCRPTRVTSLLKQCWSPQGRGSHKNVDVVQHIREKVVRLNREIEHDQSEETKFALADSAFVQFRDALDAHLVCQSVASLTPFEFSAAHVGLNSQSIAWKHVVRKWWVHYIRTSVVGTLVSVMVIGWAVPVALTGALSQLSRLQALWPWLRHIPPWLFGLIQGVLPQIALMILTSQSPNLLRQLAERQGFAFNSRLERAVQRYYFCFLFLQVFLTVAVSSSVTSLLGNISHGFDSTVKALGTSLPASSNYFLSYLLLQGLSTSGSELVRAPALIQYYVLAPLLDKTPRQVWKRRLSLSTVQWGTVFPVYTNLACIGRRPVRGFAA